MSDKKKQAKQNPESWLYKKIEEIESTIGKKKTFAGKVQLFFELLKPFGIIKVEAQQLPIEQLTIAENDRVRLGENLFRLSELIREKNLKEVLWSAWGQIRKGLEDPEFNWADFLASSLLIPLDDSDIEILYLHTMNDDWNFNKILDLSKADKPLDPRKLEYFGALLRKLVRVDWFLGNEGSNLCALAQALKVKDELKKETADETKRILAETRELFNKDTDDKLEKFDGRIQGIEARFIQIIGIFAAIIAFVVTMVPAAIRLGGASIPVALAGLAIVVGGIIFILAMIFGKDDKPRRGLTLGLIVAGALFVGWFVATILLASVKPELLRPPPDAGRVDTVYQYRVDTVKTPIYIKPQE